jgi:hypothetical protein
LVLQLGKRGGGGGGGGGPDHGGKRRDQTRKSKIQFALCLQAAHISKARGTTLTDNAQAEEGGKERGQLHAQAQEEKCIN